jgi:Tfp pilus assembly protein PilF
MNTRWFVYVLLIFLLAGCAGPQGKPENANHPILSSEPILSFGTEQFDGPQDILPIEDIYRLSDKQQRAFLKYFEDPIRLEIPANERVWNYLQDITMNFHYQGETYAAAEALRKSSGNCLSLAILTTALAKLAEVDTGYQLVESTPVFESNGNIVFKAQHVRTKLFHPKKQDDKNFLLLSRGGLLVDYFPQSETRFVSNISEAQYHAMYYNNLAGEAIANEDYNTAFWLLRKSLELTPNSAGSINAMAILYRRTGNLEKAEDVYKYGIENLEDKISLLRNYRVLLEQQDRHDEVRKINRTLERLDDPSPFDWLHAGHGAYNDGQFMEAVVFYRKAAKIAPYLHESYAGMAKAYYKIGDRESAKREFDRALQYSYRSSTRSMYEAKLLTLNSSL